jgi:7-cyano-7-deazaguanine reductase
VTAGPDIPDDNPQTASPPGRREILETRSNPQTSLDYLVAIDAPATPDRAIRLQYVPDKLLLRPDAFDNYLAALTASSETPAEEMALAIIEDINNEVVPRWVQVQIENCASDPQSTSSTYRVVIEDRQPNWDNPQIIARPSDR